MAAAAAPHSYTMMLSGELPPNNLSPLPERHRSRQVFSNFSVSRNMRIKLI